MENEKKEKKEKIVLKDGTEFEIESGATENKVQVICEKSIAALGELYEKFTEENLTAFQITDYDGNVFTKQTDKYVGDINIKILPEKFIVSFGLEDVDKIQKAVDAAIDAYTEQLIQEGIV